METREPFKRGMANDEAGLEMDLPEGQTCESCAHCRRCCMMFGHIPDDEVCDWSPSKFQPKAPNACGEPGLTEPGKD